MAPELLEDDESEQEAPEEELEDGHDESPSEEPEADSGELSGSEEEPSEQNAPVEPEVAMADVDDFNDPEGYFDGVESSSEDSAADTDSFFDGEEAPDSEDTASDSTASAKSEKEKRGSLLDSEPSPLADRINETAAKIGVLGMEKGQQKDDLEEEFLEIFQTAQLGRYGAEVAEEYMDMEDVEIDPVWGLVGALLICSAVVVWRRPDIDATKITDSLGGGVGSLSKFSPLGGKNPLADALA